MTERLELYRCEICGNIVQIMHEGANSLVCCGQPMVKLNPHSIEEEKKEKHVPVFKNKNLIQVGSEEHPMLEEHYIEFIQAISEDKKHIETKFLNAGEKPEMELCDIRNKNCAREYCNIHGLWHSK